MNEKYLVETISEESDYEPDHQTFKTKGEIAAAYNLPMYFVDKLIKISNDPGFVTKRKSHRVFQDIECTMKILLIKPKRATG